MKLTQPEIKTGDPVVITTATEYIEEFISKTQVVIDQYEEEMKAVLNPNGYACETQEEYEAVAEGLMSNKTLQARISGTFDTPKDLAFKLHRSISSPESELLAPLKADEAARKGGMKAFLQKQEQERIKAEAVARRKAEEEAEAHRKELMRQQEEQRLAAAAKLHDEGNKESAQAVLDAPIVAPKIVPIVAPVVQQSTAVKGISTKKTWKARIVDEDLIPRQYLIIDEKKIAAIVKAMGPEHGIPGVEAEEDMNIGSRKG